MNIPLSNEQLCEYHEKGYLLVKKVFSNEIIAKAIQIVEKILSHEPIEEVAELEPNDKNIARRIWSPTKRNPFFMEMATNTKLLDMIEQIIGSNILLHYSKLNLKGPKVGSLVDWHQDFAYYPHTNTDLLSCLVHLDAAFKKNACLQVLPGMHKLGVLSHYDKTGYFRGKILKHAVGIENITPVSIPSEPGDVIIIHCLTPHYSPINTSSIYRRVFIPAYRAADAFPIYFGSHASHNEPDITLIRGKTSNYARTKNMNIQLPLPEKPFSSLYQIQEGFHLGN